VFIFVLQVVELPMYCRRRDRLMSSMISALSPLPLHRRCGLAWKLNAAADALVQGPLVLCADHELNAWSFAARVVASTGATPREAVRGGLAALSGPRHGQGQGHCLSPVGCLGERGIARRADRFASACSRLCASALFARRPACRLAFALVALRRHLRLPRDSAFVLFALGRTAGWIAHALEQRSMGLIRPRATYTGRMPDGPAAV